MQDGLTNIQKTLRNGQDHVNKLPVVRKGQELLHTEKAHHQYSNYHRKLEVPQLPTSIVTQLLEHKQYNVNSRVFLTKAL